MRTDSRFFEDVMSENKLLLILTARQGYLRSGDADFSVKSEGFFQAMTQSYIPLLNMARSLEADGVPFKIGLVLTPPLCEMLFDPLLQSQYEVYLSRLERLGEAELSRCSGSAEYSQAARCFDQIQRTKVDFVQVYGRNLLQEVRRLEKEGFVELIPTAATYAYLPHYADFPEAVNAQVETGIYSNRHFFADTGEGFWLPFLGYPKDIDQTLRSYGASYTVVDARTVLFSEDCPQEGIFYPVRSKHSLVLFAKDPDTPDDIRGEGGYCHAASYLCAQRDIGFDLSREDLAGFLQEGEARAATGFSYWSCESTGDTLVPYDKEAADRQVQIDARSFVEAKAKKLYQARELMEGETPVLTCVIPLELLGQVWREGIEWLECVFRYAHTSGGFVFEHCKSLLEKQFSLQKIEPYPCSSNGLGYGEDLLDESNSWMMRYTRKATKRMIDLAQRLPSETSLKERLLNTAARQVLLAQSGEWARMLHDGKLPDRVKEIFREEILSFTRVFDSLASNVVSMEWLIECEKRNAIFPWLNYRIFSKKH